eukprot:2621385-Rhodomonas_salina.1
MPEGCVQGPNLRSRSRRRAPPAATLTSSYLYIKLSKYTRGTRGLLCGFDQEALCNDGTDNVCWENKSMGIECEDGSCCNKDLQTLEFIKIWVQECKVAGKGLGLFAAQWGRTGKLVEEMVGEVIRLELANGILAQLEPDAPNYLCHVREGVVINAAEYGNRSRHRDLNHSCAPNAQLQPILVRGELRVGVRLLEDVEDGEEITIGDHERETGSEGGAACLCGATACRGTLRGRPGLAWACVAPSIPRLRGP